MQSDCKVCGKDVPSLDAEGFCYACRKSFVQVVLKEGSSFAVARWAARRARARIAKKLAIADTRHREALDMCESYIKRLAEAEARRWTVSEGGVTADRWAEGTAAMKREILQQLEQEENKYKAARSRRNLDSEDRYFISVMQDYTKALYRMVEDTKVEPPKENGQ